MGGQTISTSETRLEALKIQSSAFGVTIAWVRGVNRIAGNLIDYANFIAVAHTETQSGGKGGGGVTQKSTTYTYTATVLMGLCQGPITAVPRVWRGQSVYTDANALDQLGLSLIPGSLDQGVWSGLAGLPTERQINYPGLAFAAGGAYDLGSGAQLENHNFEIVAPMAYTIAGLPDIDISLALREILIDADAGAGFPTGYLDAWSSWSDFLVASNLLMSPALITQASAMDVLSQAATLTNTGIVWSGGLLKMIPYADTAVSGNGRTFTPNTTPVYHLDDSCYTPSGMGDAPIQCQLKSPADRYNNVKVQFNNRANQYQTDMAEAEDLADIEATGLRRTMDTINAPWICDAAVARLVAQIVMQRSLCVLSTYTVPLPVHYSLVECMDILTLTDETLELLDFPVRVTEIAEDSEEGDLVLTCEDYTAGNASAALYPSQGGAGFQHDYNAAPGPVDVPVIFEAPGALTVNGLELYVAANGGGAAWGGCTVWVSLDGTSYRAISSLVGGSRYGALRVAAAANGVVQIAMQHGMLTSGSAADAEALNTLCFIGGAQPEFLAYTTATLVAAGLYDLAGLHRAVYATPDATHEAFAPFVRVDSALGRSGPIDLGYIGRTIHIKLTSFNIYNAAEESLADVVPYSFTITGSQVLGNAGAAAFAGISNSSSDNVLSGIEKPAIILDYTNVIAEQAGIDADATASGITTQKTAYDTALANLIAYLATLTAPTLWNDTTGSTTIVGTDFRAKWAALYAARQALFNAIDAAGKASTAVAKATADAAAITAGNAATAASNAASAAATANGQIADIASDNVLTPGEKPTIIQDWNALIAERGGINAQAAAYGVYTGDYNARLDYMGTLLTSYATPVSWSDLSGSTNINGADLRAQFVDAYTTRQIVLNAIAKVAGTLANWATVSGAPLDSTNLVLTPTFEAGARGWALYGATVADIAGQGTPWRYTLSFGTRDTVDTTNTFAVTPGETLFVGADFDAAGANGVVRFGIQVYDQSHVLIPAWTAGCGVAAHTSRSRQDGKLVVPVLAAGQPPVAFAQPWLQIDTNPGDGGSAQVTNLYIGRHQLGATLGADWDTNVTGAAAVNLRINTARDNAAAAQIAADNANTALAAIASDNVLSKGEKSAVALDWQALSNEYPGIIGQANSYGITAERDAYSAGINALFIYLESIGPTPPNDWQNPAVDSTIVGSTFRAAFTTAYAARQNLLNRIYAGAKSLADAAQTQANNAFTNAGNAQTAANAANGVLNLIASDGWLTKGEKPAVVLDWMAYDGDYQGNVNQANALGVANGAYNSAHANLAAYLNSIGPTINGDWANTAVDSPIDPVAFKANWTAAYEAETSLLNAIAAKAATLATWSGVAGRPVVYRVGARGALGSGQPLDSGIYNEAGTLIEGARRSYMVVRVRRSDGAIVFFDTFDVYGGTYTGHDNPGVTIWDVLNGSGSDVIVVVYTYDDPQNGRLNAPMYAAMKRCGASSGVFGSPLFQQRGAYILVGVGGCGEGNGAEVYAGAVPSDSNSWCELTFSVLNGAFTVSGATQGVRTLADLGYTGDTNATYGANWTSNVVGADAVNAAISAAATAASTAQGSADTANTALAAVASDNVLSKGEKAAVLLDWQTIANERAGILAQAVSLSITTEATNYNNSVDTLGVYLNTIGPTPPNDWQNAAVDSTIDGPTFRGKFGAVYTYRQIVLNRIAAVAATTSTWTGVTGAGKPADNATKGATLGVDINGSIDWSNVDTYIKNVAIAFAQIQNLAVGTGKIADLAVTQGKIAMLAVGTAQMIDASTTTLKVAGKAITAPAFQAIDYPALTMNYDPAPGDTSGSAYDVFIQGTLTNSFASSIALVVDGVNKAVCSLPAGSIATLSYAVALTPGNHTINIHSDSGQNGNLTTLFCLATKR